jgi:hypothetical protein
MIPDPPSLPPLTFIRQVFPRPRIEDVEAELRRQLAGVGVKLKPRGQYAIAVGSRGIANLARLVRRLADWVKAQGAEPFIVPAMGSHGGATAEGQRQVIESYGVTEQAMGAPIRSSMDVVELPRSGLELPTYFDRHAAGADGTLLINRIKPHTCFHGPYESGLAKMLVIGLGKHAQALAIHQQQRHGTVELLPQIARNVLRHANVALAVALVENAYDETCLIRALLPGRIMAEEPSLLDQARANMPRLPAEELDILVLDEIGKNISGVGLDPNIIGRMGVYDFADAERPQIRVIVIRDLTPESYGNALGMGLADIMTRRLLDKIDWSALHENLFTSTYLDRGKTPVVADTDAQAMSFALRAAGPVPVDGLRIARVRNTLRLAEALVSPAVLRDLAGRPDVQVVGPAGEWFASGGRMQPFAWSS